MGFFKKKKTLCISVKCISEYTVCFKTPFIPPSMSLGIQNYGVMGMSAALNP